MKFTIIIGKLCYAGLNWRTFWQFLVLYLEDITMKSFKNLNSDTVPNCENFLASQNCHYFECLLYFRNTAYLNLYLVDHYESDGDIGDAAFGDDDD